MSTIPSRAMPAPLRLLGCIRLDEVCVLQGAPVMGALFAAAQLSPTALASFALLVAGNLCLVGHVFVLNDCMGIGTDQQDATRAAATFRARGVTQGGMARLALALLAGGLVLLGAINGAVLVLGLLIALLSAAYSGPVLHGKGVPVLSSVLHLCGGAVHFLMGYAVFAAISGRAAAISAFFGLVFAAGHLTHEARDHDGDRSNGIRTNAVAFGKRRGFLAGLTLFSLAYALLAGLSLTGLLPLALAPLALVALPLHLFAARRAWRAGLSFVALRTLQTTYRRLHAVIGVAMMVSALPWPWP